MMNHSLRATHKTLIIVLVCLFVSAAAYFWATGLLSSLEAYRSPLHNNPPSATQSLVEAGFQPASRRFVFVLVDALREDTSHRLEVMPFLNALRQQGAWATVHSRPPSYSQPGYSVLFTGAWQSLNDGPVMNLEEFSTWSQDNLFSTVHRAGYQTGASAFDWFETLIPQEAVDVSFYTPGEDRVADEQVLAAALPWLEAGDIEFVMIHLDQVDYAGHHEGGPLDSNWDAAARRVDSMLSAIAASLDFSQDTLLVVSDHGQIDRGGHGGHDPVTLLEPFVLVGAGVKPGHYDDIQQVDVAPTVAALLGAGLPASSQGSPQVEMLALSGPQRDQIQEAERVQKQGLYAAYRQGFSGDLPDLLASATPADYVQAIADSRLARQAAERWPRLFLAFLLVLLPPAWVLIAWRKGRLPGYPLLVYLGGAIFYTAGFHITYRWFAGRVYSLSSVASSMDLILFCGVVSAGILLIACLLVWAFLKAGNRTPPQADQAALVITLFVLYSLALPVLAHSAVNGPLTTWALPDFNYWFLALLSLVQMLFVGISGVLYAGIAALYGTWFNSRKKKLTTATRITS